MMARRNAPGCRGATRGWPRRLGLLLAIVLAFSPALGFAAMPGNHPMAPVAHAGRSAPAHHHQLLVRQAADTAMGTPCGHGTDHHAAGNANCCDACPFAVGLTAAVVEPALSPRFTRVVRLSDPTPPGVPVATPIEPPRS